MWLGGLQGLGALTPPGLWETAAFAMEVRPGSDSQAAPRLAEQVAEARSALSRIFLRALPMMSLCTFSTFPHAST